MSDHTVGDTRAAILRHAGGRYYPDTRTQTQGTPEVSELSELSDCPAPRSLSTSTEGTDLRRSESERWISSLEDAA